MADAPLLHRLREMILTGALAPGERLTEVGLADRLGVSRTPVRNALPALAAEGLVEPIGRRGFAVRAFSDAESVEALELRALLEGHAARSLAQRGASPDLLAELQQCLDQGDALFASGQVTPEDEERYGEINSRFHDLVIAAGGSATLKALIERVNRAPFVSPSAIAFDKVGQPQAFILLLRAHGHHHAIVDAIRQRDGARAETLFREHAHQQRLSMFTRLGSKGV